MLERAVERLARAIGYPDTPAETGGGGWALLADGHAIVARERGGRVVLECALQPSNREATTTGETPVPPKTAEPPSHIATLAEYAAGRMLKEEAALAWGESGLFLWADAPADAPARELAAFFERFAASCDWWRERTDELQTAPQGRDFDAETIIRP